MTITQTRLSPYWLGCDDIAVWRVQNTFLDFYVAPAYSGSGKNCDSAGRKRALSVDSGSSEMRRRGTVDSGWWTPSDSEDGNLWKRQQEKGSVDKSGSWTPSDSEDGNLWKSQQESPDCREKHDDDAIYSCEKYDLIKEATQKFEEVAQKLGDSAYQLVGAPGDSLEGPVPIKLCYPDDYKVVIEKVDDEQAAMERSCQVVIEKVVDEQVVIEEPNMFDEKGADVFALNGQMSLVNDPDDVLSLAPDIGTATVMIRHIACRYTRYNIAELLNQAGLQDTYVFIHVPISPRKSKPSNLGYAFVCFKSEYFADACRQRFSGKVFGESSSSKLCEISAAHFPEKMRSGSMCKKRRRCPAAGFSARAAH